MSENLDSKLPVGSAYKKKRKIVSAALGSSSNDVASTSTTNLRQAYTTKGINLQESTTASTSKKRTRDAIGDSELPNKRAKTPMRSDRAMASGEGVPVESTLRAGKPKRGKVGEGDRVHGVQKLKSALRQTRRLLAKEKLAADRRVQAERQLASLTEDLAKAELVNKERDMAGRYHMVRVFCLSGSVWISPPPLPFPSLWPFLPAPSLAFILALAQVKFFERQKLLRKISQAKKVGDEKTLWERRVDLAYVLHFPKTQKYISVLKQGVPDVEGGLETSAERARIRAEIERRIRSGEIAVEVERGLDSPGEKTQPSRQASGWQSRRTISLTQPPTMKTIMQLQSM
ncbi:hypothetical protein BKA62DRAFT_490669 [Auriculariales sp. MPI-PUGE-AT-0066]|nr:hypothetical protein BKA62DRAFT_490669 [Auriculariales sp. MPI-PUGE-AT-0066]